MKDSSSQRTTHRLKSSSTSTKPSHDPREHQGDSIAPRNASVERFEHKTEAPSLKLEKIRRRAMKEHREMWYYLSAEVTKINKNLGSSLKARLTEMLDNFAEMHRTLGNNLDRINNHDSLLSWRKKEQAKLSKLVQNRLKRLQNPKDCNSARKLLCDLNKGCGYGCQVHHLLYCFITAYGTKRTLIINSYGWRYSEKGWEGVFVPASNTCTVAKGQHEMWSVNSENSKIVQLPIVDGIYPEPKHLPLAVPKDLVERIQSFHGFPFVWWIGQFAKYLFQYQPKIKQEIDEKKIMLGFKTPIVGIHIRRTDKVNVGEAAYHSIEEYMYWVDLYYKKLSLSQKVDQKNVYLASDDFTVLSEAKKKYPHYNFVSDNEISKSAGVNERYNENSLHGLIFDIQMLSECDFIVCTLSSQVCRVAYEMMQANSPTDASERVQSLDDVYYFGGQSVNDVQAVYSYKAKNYNEVNMKPGDRLKIAGNHWDGFSKGTSRANGKLGMFPSYLVEKYVHIVDFPDYSDFDKELK
ncbi:alpha-(1,6)-fucosyltransferase-like [Dendronephthya gigantea]|uniref:alpha-(1,6)-fucosyltransferase-like n=1 Tax=Dendronephthya gigantea TaxID=151771 RepID=UPI0010697C14|nr:alpha-(1,6)-fucosyltransferase-like [Dendronephthya gigantea]